MNDIALTPLSFVIVYLCIGLAVHQWQRARRVLLARIPVTIVVERRRNVWTTNAAFALVGAGIATMVFLVILPFSAVTTRTPVNVIVPGTPGVYPTEHAPIFFVDTPTRALATLTVPPRTGTPVSRLVVTATITPTALILATNVPAGSTLPSTFSIGAPLATVPALAIPTSGVIPTIQLAKPTEPIVPTSVIMPTVQLAAPTPVPPTPIPATAIPPTAKPPTAIPATVKPPTAVPATSVPPTSVPATSAPPQPPPVQPTQPKGGHVGGAYP